MKDCEECRYLQQERAGIQMSHAGKSLAEADALASGERCAEHGPRDGLLIEVFNLSKGKPAGVCEYIGRGREGRLGNPFVIGRDGDRSDVIKKYKLWLFGHVKLRDEVFDKLRELGAQARTPAGLKLLCHCKPLPCHGDVIGSCLRYLAREGLL